jgi:hypothetical protein
MRLTIHRITPPRSQGSDAGSHGWDLFIFLCRLPHGVASKKKGRGVHHVTLKNNYFFLSLTPDKTTTYNGYGIDRYLWTNPSAGFRRI